MQTATQQGVENPRNEIMAEIVANREAQIGQELQDSGVDIATLERMPQRPEGTEQGAWDALDDDAKAALVEADEQRKAAEAKAGETTETPETPETPAATPVKVKIKVDGKEVEVDQQAIIDAGIKTLQKESAADRRLEDAARIRQEAEAALVAARNTQIPNGERPPAGGATAVEKLTDDNFVEAVKAIQYGSTDEAKAALKALVQTAAQSGQADSLTLAQATELLEFREATKWAHDEFKDILGDPKLKSLFVNEEKRLRAAGDMRPYREVYTDIGSGLREWKTGLAPTPAPAPALNRQERKATVVSIPAAAVRQQAPQPVKEASPSAIVDQMRKARHQA